MGELSHLLKTDSGRCPLAIRTCGIPPFFFVSWCLGDHFRYQVLIVRLETCDTGSEVGVHIGSRE